MATVEILNKAIEKLHKDNVMKLWQFGAFEASGRIQIVFQVDNRKFTNTRLVQTMERFIRKILDTIKRNPVSGFDIRVGMKINNGATVFTAIFAESVVNAIDWTDKKLVLSEYATEYNLVEKLKV